MKAKDGFVLRNVVDEYILMPVDDKILEFDGAVLLNEVSAFVWNHMQTSISKENLLKLILDEFEVEEEVASSDLDELLDTFTGLEIIEED